MDDSDNTIIGGVGSDRRPFPIGEYLDMLADDIAFLRELHGGKRDWWRGHKPRECALCAAQQLRSGPDNPKMMSGTMGKTMGPIKTSKIRKKLETIVTTVITGTTTMTTKVTDDVPTFESWMH